MANTLNIGTIELGNKIVDVYVYIKGTEYRATFYDRKHHDVKLYFKGKRVYIIQHNVKYFIKPRK